MSVCRKGIISNLFLYTPFNFGRNLYPLSSQNWNASKNTPNFIHLCNWYFIPLFSIIILNQDGCNTSILHNTNTHVYYILLIRELSVKQKPFFSRFFCSSSSLSSFKLEWLRFFPIFLWIILHSHSSYVYKLCIVSLYYIFICLMWLVVMFSLSSAALGYRNDFYAIVSLCLFYSLFFLHAFFSVFFFLSRYRTRKDKVCVKSAENKWVKCVLLYEENCNQVILCVMHTAKKLYISL